MTYQSMKPIILNLLWLSRDAVHIHVGFICLMLTMCFSKLKLSSFKILIPTLIVSIIMELLDMRDDYYSIGRVRIMASLHDLLNTNFIPVMLVLLAKLKKIRI